MREAKDPRSHSRSDMDHSMYKEYGKQKLVDQVCYVFENSGHCIARRSDTESFTTMRTHQHEPPLAAGSLTPPMQPAVCLRC